ncbi:influenza virus NS1A-binding protein homolog isoform X3 [Dermacentor variabilis]|uniref:influenza virus NS1A-binding protein homolog isoform X3 n=1 Tax=Dermacentor variabilis TaxID=34621 RepID=UPI003F5AF203
MDDCSWTWTSASYPDVRDSGLQPPVVESLSSDCAFRGTNSGTMDPTVVINTLDEDEQKPAKPAEMLVFDDSAHLNKVLMNLNKLRKNKQFCDVVLHVGSGQDMHEIYAHRAVVASVSPYLFELLAQKTKGTLQNQCKINGNFDISAFERLVDYAYTSRLEVPKSKMKAMYLAAAKLKVHPVTKYCGKYLVEHLTPDNCTGVRAILVESMDQELVAEVDAYLRENIAEVVKSKELQSLPHIQVELVQHSSCEMDATNNKHLCHMVLDWMRSSFDQEGVLMETLTEKVHMLYLNLDRTLHDCNDIETGDAKDTELIQDYKRLSRRLSQPKGSKTKGRSGITTPAKPRQFLYTRSDSSGSSSSDEEDRDWKIIATTATGAHSTMGLAVVSGTMIVLSVVQRLNGPASTGDSSPEVCNTAAGYTTMPPMMSSRCGMGTAEFQGRLLVCGGYDRGECLRTVEAYNLATNRWSSLAPMQTPRGRVDATILHGLVYVIGGSDGSKELASAEVFNGSTWSTLPPMPVARSNAGVCNLDNKVFVVGGWNGKRGLSCCDVFDPLTKAWSSAAPMLLGRYQAGVACLNREVYAVGGCDSWTCVASVEKYNPITNTWTEMASLQNARRGCGVVEYNGKLYAVGGHDGVRSLCSVEVYDAQTNNWSPGPSLTSCRANVGVAVVGGRLFAVGGFNGKAFLNTVEFLDVRTNEWTTFVAKSESQQPVPHIAEDDRDSSREGSAEECR